MGVCIIYYHEVIIYIELTFAKERKKHVVYGLSRSDKTYRYVSFFPKERKKLLIIYIIYINIYNNNI